MVLGPLEEGIQSPETKREVNDSVYLLSKCERLVPQPLPAHSQMICNMHGSQNPYPRKYGPFQIMLGRGERFLSDDENQRKFFLSWNYQWSDEPSIKTCPSSEYVKPQTTTISLNASSF